MPRHALSGGMAGNELSAEGRLLTFADAAESRWLGRGQRPFRLQTTQILRKSGRGGIRTPETAQRRLTVFKTAAFNRSATLPGLFGCYALVYALGAALPG